MRKRTREIIALLLLVVLGIGVVFAMGWYILVGHNWNVAASNIDDSIGQMEGYTVFLVEGTRPLVSVKQEADEASENATPQAPEAQEEQQPSESPQEPAEETASQASEETQLADELATEWTSEEAKASLSALVREYKEKGAEVVIVSDWLDGAYASPRTMRISSRDVSVFEVNDPARPAAVRTQAKLLERRGSDFDVLLTNDSSIEGNFFGNIDIIVLTSVEDDYQSGHYSGYSYCVSVPQVGQVEAILVSPSGVISSKTLDLLRS